MAATVAEIRAGLLSALRTAFTTTAQMSAYQIPTTSPPALQVIAADQVIYDRTAGRGVDEWEFTVRGYGGPVDEGAQITLDKWLNPTGADSVKAAIEADRTLGGKVLDTHVTGASGYRPYKLLDGTVALGVEWNVRVLNRGA